MPKSFQLIEPLTAAPNDLPFGVGSQGTPVFECARILCGTVDLKSKSTGSHTKLRFCHVSQKTRRASTTTIPNVIELLFDGDLNEEDVRIFLQKSAGENRKFWEELRVELCFCLFWRSRQRHVEAFLHMYRILELISVALPLVYASRIADFREAVSFIKSLSKNDRDQDLSVLRYFSCEISKSGPLSHLDVDFPFRNFDPAVQEALADQLRRWVFPEKNVHGEMHALIGDGAKVGFSSVPSFIVSCRNRLFHNALSNDNFKLDALHGPGPVCQMIVDPALYWFGFIIVEILKAQAKRYV